MQQENGNARFGPTEPRVAALLLLNP